MKLHKGHVARSPYEPAQAVDPKNNPRHSRDGGRKDVAPEPEKKAAPKKKAAAKKK